MSGRYILNGHETVKCDDLIKWAQWFENNHPVHVVDTKHKDIRVSTVFLGVDYQWVDDGVPHLFETMIFGGDRDQEMCDRYSTWDEAEAGHNKVLKELEDDR